jgi:hypothetical protein
VSNEVTLPTKFGIGGRVNLHEFGPHLGLAVDAEYGLNSENEGAPLEGNPVPTAANPNPSRAKVDNVFEWSNSLTLRTGIEASFWENRPLGEDRIKVRVGYVYDAKTTNEAYPTAFGTPPNATQVLTTGVGYDGGPWEVNLAYAYRFGSLDIKPSDIANPNPCRFCGYPGTYDMRINGFYVDASYGF